MTRPISRLASASKTFQVGSEQVTAVDHADFSVSPGEMVGVIGPSGSGKTTLLNLVGLLDVPSGGEVYFDERPVSSLTPAERRTLRLHKIGFVFQQLRLMPTFTVLENVELPHALSSSDPSKRREKAMGLINAVGLAGKEKRKPSKLSTGEQQRVAVARALVNDPVLVLADEPTSQLDSATGLKVVELLDSLPARLKAAVVVSTHDPKISERMGRIYSMRDGELAVQANR